MIAEREGGGGGYPGNIPDSMALGFWLNRI